MRIIPEVVKGGRLGHAVAMGNTCAVVGMPAGVSGHVHIYRIETDLNLPALSIRLDWL